MKIVVQAAADIAHKVADKEKQVVGKIAEFAAPPATPLFAMGVAHASRLYAAPSPQHRLQHFPDKCKQKKFHLGLLKFAQDTPLKNLAHLPEELPFSQFGARGMP